MIIIKKRFLTDVLAGIACQQPKLFAVLDIEKLRLGSKARQDNLFHFNLFYFRLLLDSIP